MVHLPVPAPSSFGDPAAYPTPVSTERPETQFVPVAEAQALLSYLRETIQAGTSSLDENLNAISEAAQLLTGGTGAALAMMRTGAIVCVGRSGETAPPLGARLSLNSGISGECLRKGVPLRCDDAFEDNLADPEVCRELGLRSIVALPLRGPTGVIGILEAFSSRPQAFSEEQIYFLTELSGLAEAAGQRGGEGKLDFGRKPEAREAQSPSLASIPAPVQKAPSFGLRKSSLGVYIRRYWTMAAAIAALLVVVASWSVKPGPPRPAVGRVSSLQVQSASPPSQAIPEPSGAFEAALRFKPSPARSLERNGASTRIARAAPPSALADTVVHPADSGVQDANGGANGSSSPVAASHLIAESRTALAAPEAAAPIPSAADLSSLAPATPALPKLSTPVFQGIKGGTLDRKVLPVYPRLALETRIEGDVVLEATVTENGQVQNLVVISGHPLLASAAVQAVSKWQYHPFLLNGEPVRKQTRITVTFKLP
jgi:TonB family protein